MCMGQQDLDPFIWALSFLYKISGVTNCKCRSICRAGESSYIVGQVIESYVLTPERNLFYQIMFNLKKQVNGNALNIFKRIFREFGD